jgi:sulfite exporter TauE/SafE/copper chaperone CopZ
MAKKVFKVKGMTCNSCANLIESKLKDKVRGVDASYSKGRVEVDFNEKEISEKEIVDLIECDEFCVISDDEAKGDSEDKIGLWFMIGSLALLAYFIYGWISDLGLSAPGVGEQSGFVLLFFVGVLTGLHCVSMCGAFVVSYTTGNAKNGYNGIFQHFIYGGSKVVSYAVIGGIFGFIGGVFSFSVGLRAGIAIFAGLFMISYALSMLGVGFFRRFSFNPKFLTKWAAKTTHDSKGFYVAPFMTGILSSLFIACGPLQALYLYAAGTGNFWTGFFSLGAFSLGTLPVLIGFGSLTSFISAKATKRILKIAAVLVLILGLIMLNRGLVVLGSDYSFEAIVSDIGEAGAGSSVIDGDVQVIKMEVYASGWTPDTFSLKKGVPVRWEIDVKELTGCNNEIIVRDYGLDFKLKRGMNIVEFTPDEVGTIRWSCLMGMIPGTFIVTEDGAVSDAQLSKVAASAPAGGGCGCGGGSSCGA